MLYHIQQKVNPKLGIKISKFNNSFETAEFDIFSWFVCRDIGSSLELQEDLSWAGWLSQTSA